MKEQIIKIIESKAQGKYHLEIDESDLEVIAKEILNLFDVIKCENFKCENKAEYFYCNDCENIKYSI